MLFSCSVLSDSLQSRGLLPVLHYLLEFAQLMPIESVMLSNISSTVVHVSSCPQSFPALGSLPMSWLFATGGPGIEASASASLSEFSVRVQSFQSCPTLWDAMDCSLLGSSVHRGVAMPSFQGSSQSRDQTRVSCSSCIASRFFIIETLGKPFNISPFNKYSGLTSFRIDCCDLLAVLWLKKNPVPCGFSFCIEMISI